MFTKIKTFFLLLGYKIKDLPLWDKLREIPRKTWIILGASLAGVAALTVALILLIPLITNGGFTSNGGGIFGNNEEPDSSNPPTEMGHTFSEISSIDVASAPKKLEYFVGDTTPDYTGLVISITKTDGIINLVYYDDSSEDLKITGFDSSAPTEEQAITVEYAGHTCTFTIKIKEIPVERTLVSIELVSMPKQKYRVGGTLYIVGAKILCTYSDDTTETVDLQRGEVDGFYDINKTPGIHEVKVIHFDENRTSYATTTFTVEIVE